MNTVQQHSAYAICQRACSLMLANKDAIHYTQGPLRWEGIDQKLRVVKNQFPTHGDCSSTVTWILWNAITHALGTFNTPDVVNGEHWKAGFCVPTDAECLTRTGWKLWTELEPGVDETIGYNPETGESEWTPVESVHVFEDQETVELTAKGWNAIVTPNHRWSVGDELVPTNELRPDDVLRFAAIAEDGAGLDILPADAAVIGWMLCEGHVRSRSYGRSRALQRTGQGGNPQRDALSTDEWDDRIGRVVIYQSTPDGVNALRRALVDVPHLERARSALRDGENFLAREFEVQPAWVRDLAERSEIAERGVEGFVLALNRECRQAFLDACIQGDGWHRERTTTGRDGYTRTGTETGFTQRRGQLLEAVKLAMYLQGHRPGRDDPQRVSHIVDIRVCRPTLRAAVLRSAAAARQTMWCPHTGLNTWTMRWRGQVMLTGNTGTIAAHGKSVSGTGRLGDLALYGPAPTFEHVTMCLGGGMCFSHGGESGPWKLNVDYRGDRREIRRFL